jgi:hypothetical protein
VWRSLYCVKQQVDREGLFLVFGACFCFCFCACYVLVLLLVLLLVFLFGFVAWYYAMVA